MQIAISLVVGVGLSAACGFRVFVPFLVVSAATHAGYVVPYESFRWLGTTPALVAFTIAAVIEIGAYFIPWLDHALDVIAVPAATVAGTVLTASLMADVDPFLRWSLGLIAGGAVAGGTRATMALARGGLTATTGGVANPVLSVVELALAFIGAVLAIVVPFVAVLLLLLALFVVVRTVRRLIARRKTKPAVSVEI